MNLRLAGWLLLGLALLRPATAQAYCRTTACDPTTEVCETDPDNPGCIVTGKPLQWMVPCVGVALNQSASAQVSYDEFARVAAASFGAWNQVTCDGQPASITATLVGPVACAASPTFNDEKGNANIVVFRDEDWPYPDQSSVLALTTVTFGHDSGTIYDADMEIKSQASQVHLTTTDTDIGTDLQSIITHEAGHFLGLAHTNVMTATMRPVYPPRSVVLRTLGADDRAALCDAYPPGRAGLPACDPAGPSERSLGLSSQCGGEDLVKTDDGCGCRAVATGPTTGAGLGVGLAALAAVARRRRGRAARSAAGAPDAGRA